MENAPTMLREPPPFLAPTMLTEPPPFLAPTMLREPPPFLAPTMLTEPPPFPEPSRTIDLSPLEFILALLAVITIPALIYAFFFAVKCPPWPSRRRSHDRSSETEPENDAAVKPDDKETISDVKYQKESHVKDIGSECPVCLSVFSDGEEVKQLIACKHSFHATCIDLWLNSHSNCPICRASVGEKRPNNGAARPPRVDNDLHQGLPDADNLV